MVHPLRERRITVVQSEPVENENTNSDKND